MAFKGLRVKMGYKPSGRHRRSLFRNRGNGNGRFTSRRSIRNTQRDARNNISSRHDEASTSFLPSTNREYTDHDLERDSYTQSHSRNEAGTPFTSSTSRDFGDNRNQDMISTQWSLQENPRSKCSDRKIIKYDDDIFVDVVNHTDRSMEYTLSSRELPRNDRQYTQPKDEIIYARDEKQLAYARKGVHEGQGTASDKSISVTIVNNTNKSLENTSRAYEFQTDRRRQARPSDRPALSSRQSDQDSRNEDEQGRGRKGKDSPKAKTEKENYYKINASAEREFHRREDETSIPSRQSNMSQYTDTKRKRNRSKSRSPSRELRGKRHRERSLSPIYEPSKKRHMSSTHRTHPSKESRMPYNSPYSPWSNSNYKSYYGRLSDEECRGLDRRVNDIRMNEGGRTEMTMASFGAMNQDTPMSKRKEENIIFPNPMSKSSFQQFSERERSEFIAIAISELVSLKKTKGDVSLYQFECHLQSIGIHFITDKSFRSTFCLLPKQFHVVGDQIEPITNIKVCGKYMQKISIKDCKCKDLHMCKFYLVGKCMAENMCKFSHNEMLPHNQAALKYHHLQRLRPEYIGKILSEVRNRNATTSPTICKFYNNEGGCKQTDRCQHLHVCLHFVTGTCKFGGGCKRDHDFLSERSKHILYMYGLSDFINDFDILFDLIGLNLSNGVIQTKRSVESCGNTADEDADACRSTSVTTTNGFDRGEKTKENGVYDKSPLRYFQVGQPSDITDQGVKKTAKFNTSNYVDVKKDVKTTQTSLPEHVTALSPISSDDEDTQTPGTVIMDTFPRINKNPERQQTAEKSPVKSDIIPLATDTTGDGQINENNSDKDNRLAPDLICHPENIVPKENEVSQVVDVSIVNDESDRKIRCTKSLEPVSTYVDLHVAEACIDKKHTKAKDLSGEIPTDHAKTSHNQQANTLCFLDKICEQTENKLDADVSHCYHDRNANKISEQTIEGEEKIDGDTRIIRVTGKRDFSFPKDNEDSNFTYDQMNKSMVIETPLGGHESKAQNTSETQLPSNMDGFQNELTILLTNARRGSVLEQEEQERDLTDISNINSVELIEAFSSSPPSPRETMGDPISSLKAGDGKECKLFEDDLNEMGKTGICSDMEEMKSIDGPKKCSAELKEMCNSRSSGSNVISTLNKTSGKDDKKLDEDTNGTSGQVVAENENMDEMSCGVLLSTLQEKTEITKCDEVVRSVYDSAQERLGQNDSKDLLCRDTFVPSNIDGFESGPTITPTELTFDMPTPDVGTPLQSQEIMSYSIAGKTSNRHESTCDEQSTEEETGHVYTDTLEPHCKGVKLISEQTDDSENEFITERPKQSEKHNENTQGPQTEEFKHIEVPERYNSFSCKTTTRFTDDPTSEVATNDCKNQFEDKVPQRCESQQTTSLRETIRGLSNVIECKGVDCETQDVKSTDSCGLIVETPCESNLEQVKEYRTLASAVDSCEFFKAEVSNISEMTFDEKNNRDKSSKSLNVFDEENFGAYQVPEKADIPTSKPHKTTHLGFIQVEAEHESTESCDGEEKENEFAERPTNTDCLKKVTAEEKILNKYCPEEQATINSNKQIQDGMNHGFSNSIKEEKHDMEVSEVIDLKASVYFEDQETSGGRFEEQRETPSNASNPNDVGIRPVQLNSTDIAEIIYKRSKACANEDDARIGTQLQVTDMYKQVIALERYGRRGIFIAVGDSTYTLTTEESNLRVKRHGQAENLIIDENRTKELRLAAWRIIKILEILENEGRTKTEGQTV